MGIKSIIDTQKKKILISQTYPDKDLADVVYNMLVFNNVPPEDIIYTNCDDEVSRIPEGDVGKSGIYDYLRDFFVDSYSTQKIYVIFVTSNNTKKSWGALIEVGAAWITQIEHKIFNIYDFRPEHPLDDEQQWHTSSRNEEGELCMSKLNVDILLKKSSISATSWDIEKDSSRKQRSTRNVSKSAARDNSYPLCRVKVRRISLRPSRKPASGFCSSPSAKTCPFSCRAKRVFPSGETLILPASRDSRYNTLHFASKAVCQRGVPFGNPCFAGKPVRPAKSRLHPFPQNASRRHGPAVPVLIYAACFS